MSGPLEVTTYLQIRHNRKTYWPRLIVRRHSTERPDEPEPGCVVVKLTLRIPSEAFEPLQPEAIVDVPAELIQRPVLVTAQDAAS